MKEITVKIDKKDSYSKANPYRVSFGSINVGLNLFEALTLIQELSRVIKELTNDQDPPN